MSAGRDRLDQRLRQPVLQRYLSRLQAGLAQRGYQRDFW